jgi:DNA relaxase NicK
MNLNNNKSYVGGGSNTPPTDTYSLKIKNEKRVVIDWLSVTFDHINYSRYETFDVSQNVFRDLLSFFGIKKPNEFYNLERGKRLNGYENNVYLSEHIRLLYGGIINGEGNETFNLIMSGQACREFERYLNGNWSELFNYLLMHNVTFKRLDIAYDIFDDDEIDMYYIRNKMENNLYVSPFHNWQVIQEGGLINGIRTLTGFTIQLGSKGSNQLVIYDKKLEQLKKNKSISNEDIDTDIWIRFEMRITDDKARIFAEQYASSIIANDSKEFMLLAMGVLNTFLELKKPNKNETNRSRLPMDSKWKKFLGALSEIDLKVPPKPDLTIEKKEFHFMRSYSKTYAMLDMAKDDTGKLAIEMKLKGLQELTDLPMKVINNYRKERGLEPITREDINERIDYYEKLLDMLEKGF